MRFDVITLFPEWVENVAKIGVVGRAIEREQVVVNTWNPRNHTTDVHRTVDDRPYGGGPGMVMKPEPLAASITEVKTTVTEQTGVAPKVLYLSPQGSPLNHEKVMELAQQPNLVLLCGRYEGIDQRVIDNYVDEEVSIGDYVLSGGELAALVVIDAVSRLQPEVLGHHQSAEQDSFADGLLDCPHYTRPEVFQGVAVPEVLRSGDHGKIAAWRDKVRTEVTQAKRPDLYSAWRDKNLD